MADITDTLGIFTRGDPEYLDLSKIRVNPYSISIAFMLFYLCFLVLKYPLWF